MKFHARNVRAGSVKALILAALVVTGGVGGIYLSAGWRNHHIVSISDPIATTPALPPISHRFPLSALDAKDTQEAPSVAVDRNGRVFLAWASKTSATERTVFLTTSTDAGKSFDAPKAISKMGVYKTGSHGTGNSGGHERRATPHVVAVDDSVFLSWSEALADGSGMRMVVVTSTDAGATFGAPKPVHQGKNAKPTFTAMTEGPGGSLACAWLDDRAGFQQPYASVRAAGKSEFELEQRVSAGEPGQGVCPCCPTAVAFGLDGTLFVAFRDIRNGYRDISVSRKKPGQNEFEKSVSIIPPAWEVDGCPHDGPSLAIIGDSIHVAWMDARSGPQRCYYAHAKLDDLKFEARELHAIKNGTQGNAKLFADASGGLHAVWEESIGDEPSDAQAGHQHSAPKAGTSGGRAIQYAYLAPGQSSFGSVRALAARKGAFQTRPNLHVTPDGRLYCVWNELDETGKAVVVHAVSGDRP